MRKLIRLHVPPSEGLQFGYLGFQTVCLSSTTENRFIPLLSTPFECTSHSVVAPRALSHPSQLRLGNRG